MKRFVVISSDSNDDYLFFAPIVSWAWNRIGWGVIWIDVHNDNSGKRDIAKFYFESSDNIYVSVTSHYDFRSETQAQVVRLVAADCFTGDDPYLMTSDVDMLPLSNYWTPDENKITCYGRDLSDRHFPICYIGMKASRWRRIMNLSGSLSKDLFFILHHSKANSQSFEEYWQVDQDVITEILNKEEVVRVDRGNAKNSWLPIGRIDRSAWDMSLMQMERIDAHLLRPGWKIENFTRIYDLIISALKASKSETNWMLAYFKSYNQFL